MDSSNNYWAGFMSGVCFGETLVLVWFAYGMPKISRAFLEFGGSESSLSAVVANPFVHWGAPALLLFLVFVLNGMFGRSRTMRTLSLMAAAIAGGAMVMVLYLGTQEPLIRLFKTIGK